MKFIINFAKNFWLFSCLLITTAFFNNVNVSAQSFNLTNFSINYPKFTAFFTLIDSTGKVLRTPDIPDIYVKYSYFKHGDTTVKSEIYCPDSVHGAFSVIFTLDVSQSMNDTIPELGITKLQYQKDMIKNAINLLPADSTKWEAAISIHYSKTRQIQFFSNNRKSLVQALEHDSIYAHGPVSDYNSALLYDTTFPARYGAVRIAQEAKFKPIVFFISDGIHNELNNLPADRSSVWVNRIIYEAGDTSNKPAPVTIYTISLDMTIPTELKTITDATGGKNIRTDASTYGSGDYLLGSFFSDAYSKAENYGFTYLAPCQFTWTYDCNFRGGLVDYFIPAMDSLGAFYMHADFRPNFTINPKKVTFLWDTTKPQVKDVNISVSFSPIKVQTFKFNDSRVRVKDWHGTPPPFILDGTRTITVELDAIPIDFDSAVAEIVTDACLSDTLRIFRDYPEILLNLPNFYKVCYYDMLPLGGNDLITGGKPPYRYKWTPATGLSSDTVAHPILLATSDETYLLKVTDSRNTSVSKNLFIWIDTLPDVNISFIKGSVTEQKSSFYCAENSYNRINKWTVTNGQLLTPDDKDTVQVLWTKSGPAKLTLSQTDKKTNCKNGYEMNIDVGASSVSETSAESNCNALKILNIFSDNINKRLNIAFTSEIENFISIELVNELGICEKSIAVETAPNTISRSQLSTNDLPSGVYFIILKTNSCVVSRKVLVVEG